MDMTRRGMIGVLPGTVIATTNPGNDQNWARDRFMNAPVKPDRTLTVKELAPEEVAEMQRLHREAGAALNRQEEYDRQLRKRYGQDDGVSVEFEQGYVFIRNYGDEMAAKMGQLERG